MTDLHDNTLTQAVTEDGQTNVQRLVEKMKTDGFYIGGMSLGPQATPENVAGEILRSLAEIEAGNFELIDEWGD